MKVVRFCRRVEEDEELEGEGGREGGEAELEGLED
jgi:hypothetical protein